MKKRPDFNSNSNSVVLINPMIDQLWVNELSQIYFQMQFLAADKEAFIPLAAPSPTVEERQQKKRGRQARASRVGVSDKSFFSITISISRIPSNHR